MSIRHLPLLAVCCLSTSLPLFAAGDCLDDAFEDNDVCSSAYVLSEGTHSGLVADVDDVDYFRVTVPAGERLSVYLQADNDLLASLHDAATTQDCSVDPEILLAWSPQEFHWANLTSSPKDFLIGILPAVGCTNYDMTIDLEPEPCGIAADNGLPGSRDCASAAQLADGSYPGQFVSLDNPDFLRIEVQPAELKSIDLIAPWGSSGHPLEVTLVQDCAPPAQGQSILTSLLDRRRMFLFNATAQTQTYTIEIAANADFRDATSFCSDYDLEISSEFDPHGIWAGDLFEGNDSCPTRVPIDDGRFELSASLLDQDWYSVIVEAGATLSYRISPVGGSDWTTHLRSDCTNSGPSYLALGQPAGPGSSDTVLTWKNETGVAVDANFFVIHPHNTGDFASPYVLDLRNTRGEVFCESTPNSTGGAARIDSSGSTDVNGAGTFELSATDVPANTFGLFFFSPNEISPVPFGNGLRCLGAPFRRLPVTNAGPSGVLQTTIDWSQPGTASVITPASTWSFQAWFRDAAGGGAQYDLSDGLRVEFP